MILKKSFYHQNTIELARNLLGKILVHDSVNGITKGIIVEVEAYLGSEDPAAHTYRGETKRNTAMFGDPGHAYIYFTYGMYHCFNVTAAPRGIGHGILIRALKPMEGIEIMEERRKTKDIKNLCSGPAKLVIAMGITNELYGHDLTKKPLYIEEGIKNFETITTTRIGIKEGKEMPLRFYIKDNKFISRK